MNKYKILRICPSPSHLEKFREINNLDKKKFQSQLDTLRKENLLLPGGMGPNLESHGYEVLEILYPDIQLMKSWAIENGYIDLAINSADPFEFLKKIIEIFKPDIIFIFAGALFWITRDLRFILKNCTNKNIIFIGYWGDELNSQLYEYSNYFGDLDYVFTSSDIYLKKFQEIGVGCTNIGNCFDETIKYTPSLNKDIDILFCGTTGYMIPEHFNRYNLLKDVIPKIDLKVFGDDRGNSKNKSIKLIVLKILLNMPIFLLVTLKKLCNRRISSLFTRIISAKNIGLSPELFFASSRSAHPNIGIYSNERPLRALYPDNFHDPILNTSDYLELLSRSKIVLNIHRDEDADIGNIRCYEATGVGSCLLTDRAQELSNSFVPEQEIVGFTNGKDLVEKVKYLLENSEAREKISKAGMERCHRDHLVKLRVNKIAEVFKTLLVESDSKNLSSYRAGKNRDESSILLAIYDTQGQPISYDVAFFIQAAEIKRIKLGLNRMIVCNLPPHDIFNQPGVDKSVSNILTGHSMAYRMDSILGDMVKLMPNASSLQIRSRNQKQDIRELFKNEKIVTFPDGAGIPHHSEYYHIVQEDSKIMTGFEASIQSKSHIKKWIKRNIGNKKIVTVSLRQYGVNPERNNNLVEWDKFLSELDTNEYGIVIIPDTDEINKAYESILYKYSICEIASFNVDLRFALYEEAYINLFINTGPCVAATLSKKIRYIMFKIAIKNIPTTELDFIKLLGFELFETPKYATPLQKWVWEDDYYDVIKSEFYSMVGKIEYQNNLEKKNGN